MKGWVSMARISSEERDLIENFLFLPMALKVLQQDYESIQVGNFKLKKPYIQLLEHAMTKLQKDLFQIRQEMRKARFQAIKLEADEDFTLFLFICKGFEEQHNYFNMKIKQIVQQHFTYYLYNAAEEINLSFHDLTKKRDGSSSSSSATEIS